MSQHADVEQHVVGVREFVLEMGLHPELVNKVGMVLSAEEVLDLALTHRDTVVNVRSLTGRGNWNTKGEWTHAACINPFTKSRTHSSGTAPDVDCQCGLYAWHPGTPWTKAMVTDLRLKHHAEGSGLHIMPSYLLLAQFTAIVQAAGRVIVHCDGFRAEHARMVAVCGTSPAAAELAQRLGVELAPSHDEASVYGIPVPMQLRPDMPRNGVGGSYQYFRNNRLVPPIQTNRYREAFHREQQERYKKLQAAYKAQIRKASGSPPAHAMISPKVNGTPKPSRWWRQMFGLD